MKKILIGLLVAAVVVLGGLLLKVALFPVHAIDKSVDMAYGVVDKSLTADKAIYNYEWFKQQEQDIEALYKKEARAIKDVDALKLDLPEKRNDWSRTDKDEYDRLQTIATGIGYQLDDAIATYNARSSMVNRVIFKDGLPSNITRAFLDGLKLISN